MQRNLKFKITLFTFLFAFSFIAAVFPADFVAFTGQVNANNINLRVDATVGSVIICTLPKGQLVEIVSEIYDWYKIRLPKTAPSYIKKDFAECISNFPQNSGYLTVDDQNASFNNNASKLENLEIEQVKPVVVSKSAKCFYAKVTADRVNIRLGPNESSWIMGKVNKSTVVNIIKDEGNWYKIEPIHQSYGWVNKKFINKAIALSKEAGKSAIIAESVKLPLVIENQTVPQPNPLVIEGTISPYGVVLWRKATHKLTTDNKEIYLLKGNRKGLDSLNYRKVKVTGKLISQKNSRCPIIEIAIIEVLN